MDDEVHTVVIDNGSHTCKAGFAGEDAPRIVIPSVVGYPKYQSQMVGSELKGCYVGNEVERKRGILDLKYPIERGIITNWDDMEKIWRYTFNELKVAPEEYSVLLTESVGNTKVNREKMAEIMFEQFNTRAIELANQAILPLYAHGYTTGISVNVGHGITQAVPVYEGVILQHAAVQHNLAGLDLTESLRKILPELGYGYGKSFVTKEAISGIKEKLCFVAQHSDWGMEATPPFDKRYKLPDEKVITISDERIRAPEVMFKPSLLGMESDGVHEIIYKSIMKCDINIRKRLFQNIIFSGGSTMFPGFAKRMRWEIMKLTPPTVAVEVIVPPEHEYSTWIGGSKLGCLPSVQRMQIEKEQYNECGPYILHRTHI